MIRALSPIPALYRGFALHPDDDQDPYVFRIELPWFGIGTGRVIFSREPGVGTTALHLDFAPLSFQKETARTNPEAVGHRRARRAGGGHDGIGRPVAQQAMLGRMQA